MSPTVSRNNCRFTGLNRCPQQWRNAADSRNLIAMSPLRRFWPVLAVVAGAALIAFELRRSKGITAENAFWLLIGALVVVLATVDLIQRWARPRL